MTSMHKLVSCNVLNNCMSSHYHHNYCKNHRTSSLCHKYFLGSNHGLKSLFFNVSSHYAKSFVYF